MTPKPTNLPNLEAVAEKIYLELEGFTELGRREFKRTPADQTEIDKIIAILASTLPAAGEPEHISIDNSSLQSSYVQVVNSPKVTPEAKAPRCPQTSEEIAAKIVLDEGLDLNPREYSDLLDTIDSVLKVLSTPAPRETPETVYEQLSRMFGKEALDEAIAEAKEGKESPE